MEDYSILDVLIAMSVNSAPLKIKTLDKVWDLESKNKAIGYYNYDTGIPTLLNFNYLIENGRLKEPVEVLVDNYEKEDTEWEDIKQYEIEGSPDSLKISQDYLRDIKCTMVEGLLAETINQIIANQKRIIERLNKDGK